MQHYYKKRDFSNTSLQLGSYHNPPFTIDGQKEIGADWSIIKALQSKLNFNYFHKYFVLSEFGRKLPNGTYTSGTFRKLQNGEYDLCIGGILFNTDYYVDFDYTSYSKPLHSGILIKRADRLEEWKICFIFLQLKYG